MIKPELFSDLFEQANQLLPGAKQREELQKSIQVMMQSSLAKLDLVTRKEFDAQAAVLQRTRAKVDELEKQLEELSGKIDKQ